MEPVAACRSCTMNTSFCWVAAFLFFLIQSASERTRSVITCSQTLAAVRSGAGKYGYWSRGTDVFCRGRFRGHSILITNGG